MADLFSANDFAEALAKAIQDRNDTHDVDVGPIPDIVINPLAGILAQQEGRIDRIKQLLLLQAAGTFSMADLEEFVANERIFRLPGSPSSVMVTFYKHGRPNSPCTVRANHPVGTMADEETGRSITFVTSAAVTLPAEPQASAFWNPVTRRYEVSVMATSTEVGEITKVGPNRITRSIRPLTGFDGVTNTQRAWGGRGQETAVELVARYLVSLMGTVPATVSGIAKTILTEHRDVLDHLVVFGGDPQLTRASSDAGAVDVHILGNVDAVVREQGIYLGVGQKIYLKSSPLNEIVSVTNGDGSETYLSDTDFYQGTDAPGLAGSVRARDFIVFRHDAIVKPNVGDPVQITYTRNALIPALQTAWRDRAKEVPGRDLLFRAARQVNIVFSADLYVESGFNPVSVQNLVTRRLIDYLNGLKLGQPVEASDLHREARRITGVDNLIITALHVDGGAGTADIPIAASEYARVADVDFTLSIA